jgi:hypothetical protein
LNAAEVSARSFPHEGIDLYEAAIVGFDNGAIGSFFGGAGVPEGGRARLRLSVAGSKGIIDLNVDLALGEGKNRSPAEIGAKTVELIVALRRSSQSAGERLHIKRHPARY